MGIKWEDVNVMCTAISNQICLCKSKPIPGAKPGCMMATDKSGDKTEQVVKAVMEHMLGKCRESKSKYYEFTIPGVVKLSCEDFREES